MQTAQSRDGTTIAYDRSGEGAPLILVGGALSTREAAEPLAALLSPRFTVLSFDRRGRGDSGDTQPYAVKREVEDIAALIDAAGGSAFVYGMSSGAILSLYAASALGSHITKLALYEPPFIVDDTRPPAPPDYVAHLTDLLAQNRRGDAVEYFMTAAVMADMPAEVAAGIVAQMKESPMWAGMEAVARTLPYDGLIAADFMVGSAEPLRQWAGVTIPTLVMDGGASPHWMHNAARTIADILPNAERRTLPDQTHAVDPAVLAPALIAFFGS